jgi:hypothetical protein
MKIKVWVISTCVPDENTPCLPEVLGSLDAAKAKFDELMRAEWEANQPEDEQTSEPLPYPGDASKAHEILAKNPRWGHWQITGHEIEIP